MRIPPSFATVLHRHRATAWCAIAVVFSLLSPVSAAEEIVGNVRVQVLSNTLVRIEQKGPAGFEDRPTFHIVNRDLTGAPLTRTTNGTDVSITTEGFTVKVPENAADLSQVSITKPDGTFLWSAATALQTPTRIRCRWAENQVFLKDNGTTVGYGSDGIGDEYYWIFEPVGDHYRIKNLKSGHYMHIENLSGSLECGTIQTTWESAKWNCVADGGYLRIRNQWRADSCINVEALGGTARCGAIVDTWNSAQWSLTDKGSLGEENRTWIPHPRSQPQVFSIKDTPRMIPPLWGYNVAPAGASFADNNGWDLTNDAADHYVFIPNGDGLHLRNEYLQLTGKTELVPLSALGVWNSRYYAYTQEEALEKINRYRDASLPLDVLVIDTDWRVGASSGYGVNTTLFPDMEQFLADAHDKKVKIIFNDHPEPQAADCLKPLEVAYRNDGLRGVLDMGIDWWWFDRNWHVCLVPPAGINKEVFGMYLYNWVAADHDPDRRPFIMTNADGMDNGFLKTAPNIAAHRYTCQWTGDISATNASLAREISNVIHYGVFGPFPYVSADLGGHNTQPTGAGLCRWLEFGALSPFFRPHCTRGMSRDPWDWGDSIVTLQRNYTTMRMRMLPVFYTAAKKNYDSGEPIVRRCDLDYPDYNEASTEDQYLLGNDLLVAPIIGDNAISRSAWIPPGIWTNVWTGEQLSGPATATVNADLGTIPLFVKQGSIIPLAPAMQYTSERPWDTITLDIYPAENGTATASLYEDDGSSIGYKTGASRTTTFESITDNATGNVTVSISAAAGTYPRALTERSWRIRLHGIPSRDTLPGYAAIGTTISELTPLARAADAMPFGAAEGAPDGAVVELILPSSPITEAQRVVFGYDRSVAISQHNLRIPETRITHRGNGILHLDLGASLPPSWQVHLRVCNLKGQLVAEVNTAVSGSVMQIPLTGKTGSSLGAGCYVYTVDLIAADRVMKQTLGELFFAR